MARSLSSLVVSLTLMSCSSVPVKDDFSGFVIANQGIEQECARSWPFEKPLPRENDDAFAQRFCDTYGVGDDGTWRNRCAGVYFTTVVCGLGNTYIIKSGENISSGYYEISIIPDK